MQGRLALAKGHTTVGLDLLAEAAKLELELRQGYNDPPYYPHILFNVLGEARLKHERPKLAAKAFETAIEHVPNDPMALAGLVQAYAVLGERDKATEYYGRLLHVWSNADPDLRWLKETKDLGLSARAKDASPRAQREYRSIALDELGPGAWKAYPAPALKAVDSRGKTVTLEQYRGQNVVLVFYLGEECPHCIDQLRAIQERITEFSMLNTKVLAISSSTPEKNASSEALGSLGFRLLSDDRSHSNARRFHSYDDFEELELHSTNLIDRHGRVHWARTGGDPFMELSFLLTEIRRVNAMTRSTPAGAGQ